MPPSTVNIKHLFVIGRGRRQRRLFKTLETFPARPQPQTLKPYPQDLKPKTQNLKPNLRTPHQGSEAAAAALCDEIVDFAWKMVDFA